MCGRYSLFTPPEDLAERFDVSVRDHQPRYNAAPGQELPVVVGDGGRELRHQRWGLVPSWSDDDSGGLINARAETVADKPAFRAAYESRRCLVPADGFYEWVERDAGGGKQPYRVAFEDDRPFAMAGLWERWTPEQKQTGLDEFGAGGPDRSAEPIETFTVLTTEPNDLVASLHHRMAVILPPAAESAWLAGESPEDVFEPHPGEEMRAYPVSTAVNDPANDTASLVEPVEAGG
jgi:putative SOS response-associated peptidase YedK